MIPDEDRATELEKFIQKNGQLFRELDFALGLPNNPPTELHQHISIACHSAKRFSRLIEKDSPNQNNEWLSRHIREREQDIKELFFNNEKIDKAFDAIESLFNMYPEAKNIIASYWFPEAYGVEPKLSDRLKGRSSVEMLELNLAKLKWSFQLYEKKLTEMPWHQVIHGPLIIPLQKEQQRTRALANPAADGLIYEIELLLRCYLNGLPLDIVNRPMELPKWESKFYKKEGTRSKNEIIASIIKIILGKKYTPIQVKERIKSLVKLNAKFVGWDQYYRKTITEKTAPRTT